LALRRDVSSILSSPFFFPILVFNFGKLSTRHSPSFLDPFFCHPPFLERPPVLVPYFPDFSDVGEEHSFFILGQITPCLPSPFSLLPPAFPTVQRELLFLFSLVYPCCHLSLPGPVTLKTVVCSLSLTLSNSHSIPVLFFPALTFPSSSSPVRSYDSFLVCQLPPTPSPPKLSPSLPAPCICDLLRPVRCIGKSPRHGLSFARVLLF